MMQEFVLLLLLIFWVSWISMLRPGIEPVISFTGARDYARSAVATWTSRYKYTYEDVYIVVVT